MRRGARHIALAAILAVIWATLWPLVSASHALLVADEMPLCHQAGTMVAPDSVPQKPGGGPQDGKVHCPLCIMAFFVAFAEPPPAPQFQFSSLAIRADARPSPFLRSFEHRLPPSRAPPSPLAA
jgi:hypothetical protein